MLFGFPPLELIYFCRLIAEDFLIVNTVMQRNFPEALFCFYFRGPRSPHCPPETMILQTRYSEHECNVGHHSLHQQTHMGDGWGVQTLPSSPRQPNSIYSE